MKLSHVFEGNNWVIYGLQERIWIKIVRWERWRFDLVVQEFGVVEMEGGQTSNSASCLHLKGLFTYYVKEIMHLNIK